MAIVKRDEKLFIKVLNDKKLSLAAKALYVIFYSKSAKWHASMKNLRKLTKDTEPRIIRAIRDLKGYGLIDISIDDYGNIIDNRETGGD